ncbi:unnamed protein product, partial [Effrenium voratum]
DQSEYGATPLQLAAERGQTLMTCYLLKAGADPDLADEHGVTPLHAAALQGHPEVVQMLLGHCRSCDPVDHLGARPLYLAAENGHASVVQCLLEAKADKDCAHRDVTPLHAAARHGHCAALQLLLAARAECDKAGIDGTRALHYAAKYGHLDSVRCLIEARSALDGAEGARGCTALLLAAEADHGRVAQALLEAGADVNWTNFRGESPLNSAAAAGLVEVVQLLLASGADLESASNDGAGPLHVASSNGHLEVVRVLVGAGADKDKADCFGAAPLHVAAEQGQLAVVQYLLEVGADKDKMDGLGLVPQRSAALNEQEETVLYFMECENQGGNVTCEHEQHDDEKGKPRHFLVLRATEAVPKGAELRLGTGRGPGSAAEWLEGEVQAPPASGEPDFVQQLPLPAALDLRSSAVQGLGVFAARRLRAGEVVELAPSVLLEDTEIGGLLTDYRYSAERLRKGLFRVILGCGSIYNHSSEPNLRYRLARAARARPAQKLSVCFFAKRDIAAGEELLISYGNGWWSSRGVYAAQPDALLDVLQVRISRKCARKLFRVLASAPKKVADIGATTGAAAQLTQLARSWQGGGAATARPSAAVPEKGLQRSQSAGRTVPKPRETREREVPAARRQSGGVHLQEQIRQQWQYGLRTESPEREGKDEPKPTKSGSVMSRQNSARAPPPNANRRSYEAWRRASSLTSLLAFEAEVKARQESSASSDNEPQREPPASSPRPSFQLPGESPPPSVRLRRHSVSTDEHPEQLSARVSAGPLARWSPQATAVNWGHFAPGASGGLRGAALANLKPTFSQLARRKVVRKGMGLGKIQLCLRTVGTKPRSWLF